MGGLFFVWLKRKAPLIVSVMIIQKTLYLLLAIRKFSEQGRFLGIWAL